jgi:glycosyltransferase involved in cell wall biosynthesis/Flp pilus assembly protein TadD
MPRHPNDHVNNQLSVLFVNRPDTFTLPGGDTTLMQRYMDVLAKKGIKVAFSPDEHPDPEGYDIAVVFNLLIPAQTFHHVVGIRAKSHIPIISVPLYWDMSETWWNERLVTQAIGAANSEQQLQSVIKQIADRSLSARNTNIIKRNRPYPDYEVHQVRAAGYVDHFIAISSAEKNLLSENLSIPHDKISVVTCGVDILARDPDPNLFIEKYGIRDFVMVSGRVEGRKNQLLLLIALREMGVPVVVAGSQPDRTYLELCQRFAPKGTIFTGRLSDEMLASAKAAARVHAQPSWWECAGISSMEAGLAGASLVVGKKGAESEYFSDLAYYCDPGDVDSIREAVYAAYSNYESDSNKRRLLKNKLTTNNNWNVCTDQILDQFNQILQRHTFPLQGVWLKRRRSRELARANHSLFQGDMAGALNTLNQLSDSTSDNAEVHILKGTILNTIGQPGLAKAEVVHACELEKWNNQNQRLLGDILIKLGKIKEAEVVLNELVQHHPDDIDAALMLCNLYNYLEDAPNAIKILERLHENEPQRKDFVAGLAGCYLALGNYDLAEDFLNQAKKMHLDEVAAAAQVNRDQSQKFKKVINQIISSQDVDQAIKDNKSSIDQNLVRFVHMAAATAQKNGQQNVQEILLNLARKLEAFIYQVDTKQVSSGVKFQEADRFHVQNAQKKQLVSAAGLLEKLLEAEEIATALNENKDKLSMELVDLVRVNAANAREEDNLELAEGLDNLAEYISEILSNKN